MEKYPSEIDSSSREFCHYSRTCANSSRQTFINNPNYIWDTKASTTMTCYIYRIPFPSILSRRSKTVNRVRGSFQCLVCGMRKGLLMCQNSSRYKPKREGNRFSFSQKFYKQCSKQDMYRVLDTKSFVIIE